MRRGHVHRQKKESGVFSESEYLKRLPTPLFFLSWRSRSRLVDIAPPDVQDHLFCYRRAPLLRTAKCHKQVQSEPTIVRLHRRPLSLKQADKPGIEYWSERTTFVVQGHIVPIALSRN